MMAMEQNRPGADDALLIVDMQRDFMPGGALPVAGADALLPVINGWIRYFDMHGYPVFATCDWHPPDHASFACQGGPWPVHCVAGSEGARFARGLQLPASAHVIHKGEQRDLPGYSAFESTTLHTSLQAQGVRRLFVAGVATEYCVRASVMDALRLGYTVLLLTDAVRAVSVEDGMQAIHEMQQKGTFITQQEPCYES